MPDIPSQRQADRALSALSPLRYDASMHAIKATALASPLGPEGFAKPLQALFTGLLRTTAARRQLKPIHGANAISPKREHWGSLHAIFAETAGPIAR